MNWIVLAFIAMIANFIALVFIRTVGKKMNPGIMSMYIFSFLATSLITINVLSKNSYFIQSNTFLLLIGIGIIGGVTYLLFYTSISLAPNTGYPISIFSFNVVIVTIISTLILGTSLTITKLLGILIATVGIIILTLSK